ncbi:hypothetical protein B566_EDAN018609 [Ephemera danica]|nr:hypothetical protein B566_EDAN018609 [Ephemera danica]
MKLRKQIADKEFPGGSLNLDLAIAVFFSSLTHIVAAASPLELNLCHDASATQYQTYMRTYSAVHLNVNRNRIIRGTTAELKQCITKLDTCKSTSTENSRKCTESLSICNANATITTLALESTQKSRDKCVSDLNILNEKYSNVLEGSECSCNIDQELLDTKEELDFCNIDLSEAYIQMSKILKAFAPKVVDCHLSLHECNESMHSLYQSNTKCLHNLKKCESSGEEHSAEHSADKLEENTCAIELKECKYFLSLEDLRGQCEQ